MTFSIVAGTASCFVFSGLLLKENLMNKYDSFLPESWNFTGTIDVPIFTAFKLPHWCDAPLFSLSK